MTGITNILKGIGGEFEINRVIGAVGAIVFIVTTTALLVYDVVWRGKDFDLSTYCLTFPVGLGAAVAAIAGAVGWKDQKVANAKVTAQTGAIPAPAIDGARVPPGAPPPVDKPLEGSSDDNAGLPEGLRS